MPPPPPPMSPKLASAIAATEALGARIQELDGAVKEAGSSIKTFRIGLDRAEPLRLIAEQITGVARRAAIAEAQKVFRAEGKGKLDPETKSRITDIFETVGTALEDGTDNAFTRANIALDVQQSYIMKMTDKTQRRILLKQVQSAKQLLKFQQKNSISFFGEMVNDFKEGPLQDFINTLEQNYLGRLAIRFATDRIKAMRVERDERVKQAAQAQRDAEALAKKKQAEAEITTKIERQSALETTKIARDNLQIQSVDLKTRFEEKEKELADAVAANDTARVEALQREMSYIRESQIEIEDYRNKQIAIEETRQTALDEVAEAETLLEEAERQGNAAEIQQAQQRVLNAQQSLENITTQQEVLNKESIRAIAIAEDQETMRLASEEVDAAKRDLILQQGNDVAEQNRLTEIRRQANITAIEDLMDTEGAVHEDIRKMYENLGYAISNNMGLTIDQLKLGQDDLNTELIRFLSEGKLVYDEAIKKFRAASSQDMSMQTGPVPNQGPNPQGQGGSVDIAPVVDVLANTIHPSLEAIRDSALNITDGVLSTTSELQLIRTGTADWAQTTANTQAISDTASTIRDSISTSTTELQLIRTGTADWAQTTANTSMISQTATLLEQSTASSLGELRLITTGTADWVQTTANTQAISDTASNIQDSLVTSTATLEQVSLIADKIMREGLGVASPGVLPENIPGMATSSEQLVQNSVVTTSTLESLGEKISTSGLEQATLQKENTEVTKEALDGVKETVSSTATQLKEVAEQKETVIASTSATNQANKTIDTTNAVNQVTQATPTPAAMAATLQAGGISVTVNIQGTSVSEMFSDMQKKTTEFASSVRENITSWATGVKTKVTDFTTKIKDETVKFSKDVVNKVMAPAEKSAEVEKKDAEAKAEIVQTKEETADLEKKSAEKQDKVVDDKQKTDKKDTTKKDGKISIAEKVFGGKLFTNISKGLNAFKGGLLASLKGIGDGLKFLFTGIGNGLKALGDPKVLQGAVSLIAVSGALLVFASAMVVFSSVDWTSALIGIGVFFLFTGILLAAANALQQYAAAAMPFAVALIALVTPLLMFAGALWIMTEAMLNFESIGFAAMLKFYGLLWSLIALSPFLAIAGILLGVAGPGLMLFSVALLTLGFAINMVASAFGAIPQLVFGLAQLVGISFPLFLASLALGLSAPGLLLFGISLLSFGLGMMAAAQGVQAIPTLVNGLWALIGISPLLFVASLALGLAAPGLLLFGISLLSFGLGLMAAAEGVSAIPTLVDGLLLLLAISPLLYIASGLLAGAAPGLLLFGLGLISFGLGMLLAAQGVSTIPTLVSGLWQLVGISPLLLLSSILLGLSAPGLALFGAALITFGLGLLLFKSIMGGVGSGGMIGNLSLSLIALAAAAMLVAVPLAVAGMMLLLAAPGFIAFGYALNWLAEGLAAFTSVGAGSIGIALLALSTLSLISPLIAEGSIFLLLATPGIMAFGYALGFLAESMAMFSGQFSGVVVALFALAALSTISSLIFYGSLLLLAAAPGIMAFGYALGFLGESLSLFAGQFNAVLVALFALAALSAMSSIILVGSVLLLLAAPGIAEFGMALQELAAGILMFEDSTKALFETMFALLMLTSLAPALVPLGIMLYIAAPGIKAFGEALEYLGFGIQVMAAVSTAVDQAIEGLMKLISILPLIAIGLGVFVLMMLPFIIPLMLIAAALFLFALAMSSFSKAVGITQETQQLTEASMESNSTYNVERMSIQNHEFSYPNFAIQQNPGNAGTEEGGMGTGEMIATQFNNATQNFIASMGMGGGSGGNKLRNDENTFRRVQERFYNSALI